MTYGMYSSLGHSGPATVLTGIWNNVVKLGPPVLAFVILAVMGDATAAKMTAALIGVGALSAAVVAFALMLCSDALARRVGAAMQRAAAPFLGLAHRDTDRHWDEATVRFRKQTIGLLAGRWHVLTAATVVSHLSLYVVLLLALRHMGVSDAMVGWAQVLGIFALTRLVTALPVTPGGLGLVELALTADLSLPAVPSRGSWPRC